MLAFAGTLAIHTIVAVAADALVVTHPFRPPDPTPPKVTMIDVTVETKVDKPDPEPPKVPDPVPTPVVPTPPVPHPVRAKAQVAQTQAPAQPVMIEHVPDSGGGQVVALEGIAPSATGIAVRSGSTASGHLAQGGNGTGTGAGAGAGAGDAAPMSVATIKTRAMPKGDYGYFDAGRDYPQEAKQLGIEGPLRVRLVVDDQGHVKTATLLNHLGHGLDELAVDRARKIEFEPARDSDDHPVASVVVWTFQMTLPK